MRRGSRHLVGPLRRFGWRCGVVSTSKVKAGELKRLAEGIASNLRGLQFRRSPAPGRIESAWGVVDFLAAEPNAGAAAGAYEVAKILWRRAWRGTGASATADGSYDVRSFQAAIVEGRIKLLPSVLFPSAIGSCTLRRDVGGNPSIHKARSISRIDLCSAAVIATGLAALHGSRPAREINFTFVGASA